MTVCTIMLVVAARCGRWLVGPCKQLKRSDSSVNFSLKPRLGGEEPNSKGNPKVIDGFHFFDNLPIPPGKRGRLLHISDLTGLDLRTKIALRVPCFGVLKGILHHSNHFP